MFWPRGGNVEGNYFRANILHQTGYCTIKLNNRAGKQIVLKILNRALFFSKFITNRHSSLLLYKNYLNLLPS